MPKQQMLINYVAGEECRIAITVDGKLEELYQERTSSESHVNNIYKGRVTNVEPSIQAAFIDFGLDRNGFLHISDLHPKYFRGKKQEDSERVGKKTPHRERPPIQSCLKRGQEILVQVLKEGIGTKGPTLTSYLSIPGRFLVMMPDMERTGVSRKVEDDDARREMRKVLDSLDPPEGFGFIVRTAGVGRTKAEIKRDLSYLARLWKTIDRRLKTRKIGELYTEADLVIRTIRDVFSSDIDQIVVDDPNAAKRARDFLGIFNPRSRSKVVIYDEDIPLYDRFDIERQIENINARTVPLPSGGSLVIDSTEALVAIDVNSGKNRDNRDAETTAYKTNIEATDEICRQLRLRDLGGVIVNDLIDMRDQKHRKAIEQRFRDNLKNDRARTRTLAISQFGILEMTRQRMRPSLKKSIYADCQHCEGSGLTKSAESVVLDVMRKLVLAMFRDNVSRVELTVSPDVAFQLLNRKRADVVAIEQKYGKSVTVRVGGGGRIDYLMVTAYDKRGGEVSLDDTPNFAKPDLIAPEDYDDTAIDDADLDDDDDDSDVDETSPDTKADAPDDAEQAKDDGDSDDDEDESDDKPKRRRRRRRGGRGRGRNKQRSAQDEASDDKADVDGNKADAASDRQDDAADDDVDGNTKTADETDGKDDSDESGEDSGGKRRRRRRGGRRRRGRNKDGESNQNGDNGSDSASSDGESNDNADASSTDSARDEGGDDSETVSVSDNQTGDEGDEQSSGEKKSRRSRRGGRRRSRNKQADANEASGGDDQASSGGDDADKGGDAKAESNTGGETSGNAGGNKDADAPASKGYENPYITQDAN